MKKLTLSVIMPSLNEEENIKEAICSTLSAFDFHDIDGEIIVVNDGSTDQTREIVETIFGNNHRLRLINHKKSTGVGYSFFDGVQHSKRDIVVMFPGDNENDPVDALNYIHILDQVDMVVPFIHNSEVRNRWRRLISSLYRFIINISFGVQFHYTNGTVFYNRHILKDIQLESSGFFYQAELLIKLTRKGYLFAEVPNFLSLRSAGKSKAISLFSFVKVVKSYLKLFLEIHIKRIETQKDYRKLNPLSVSYKKCEKNYA
jgi:dolichol-phosphate mannosyltransferase